MIYFTYSQFVLESELSLYQLWGVGRVVLAWNLGFWEIYKNKKE